MPATLDPETALILIDLQHGITGLPTVHPSEQIVARGARLADAFRAKPGSSHPRRILPRRRRRDQNPHGRHRVTPSRRPTMPSSVPS